MALTIRKALYRLGGKLSNMGENGKFKPFYPDKFDIECFNKIVEFVETKEKQQLIDNQLFGKLYIFLYGEFVRYYKTTVFDNIPQKELHKLLDKDLRSIVKEALDKVNNQELINICEEEKLEKYKPMDYDEFAGNLRVMVNAALNEFNK